MVLLNMRNLLLLILLSCSLAAEVNAFSFDGAFHSQFYSTLQGKPQDTLVNSKHQLIDLGPQISQAAIQGAAFLKDKSGTQLVFTVARGIPAHLVGYELKNNTMILDVPLDSMVGSWTLAASTDGVLYIGGGAGHL